MGLLAVVLLGMLCVAGTASARQVQRYFYSGNTFDAGSTNAKALAFDNVNQKVLVVSSSGGVARVNLFSSAGLTAPFTGIGGAASFALPTEPGKEFQGGSTFSIAVDDSGKATAGNFYVSTTLPSRLYGYAANGTPLPGYPLNLPTQPCGVGVDPEGGVWVGDPHLGSYQEYSSSGFSTGKVLAFGNNNGGCQIAFDSAGNFFAARFDRLVKFDPISKAKSDFGPSAPPGTGSISGRGTPIVFDRAGDSLFTLSGSGGATYAVTQFDSSQTPITEFGAPDPAHFSYAGLHGALDLAVNPLNHDVYALTGGSVDVFSRDSSTVTVPTVTTSSPDAVTGASATLHGVADPDGVATTNCHFEWGMTLDYGNSAPCIEGNVFAAGSGDNAVSTTIGPLAKGTVYHFRLVVQNAPDKTGLGRDVTFTAAGPPLLSDTSVSHVTTDSARVKFDINPNGGATTYHVEVDGETNYPNPDATSAGLQQSATNLTNQVLTQEISGLAPDTTYEYRVVATNAAGVTKGQVQTFKTFPITPPGDPCPNAHVRQQTSASGLLDCRAYELVSATYTGGYDVRSDLSSGVTPLPAYPEAADQSLYSMQSGTIPGIAGNPTNRGADPYVATRGADGWSTKYVGIPANVPSAAPFSSTLAGAASNLSTFAFGGPDICGPCFAAGSTGVPLRKSDGTLVQGMVGSVPVAKPVSAGVVNRPLSGDGSHFVFGSKQLFVAGANNNNSDATIYDRNLKTNTTQIVSTTPAGTPIANGSDIAELDLSADGSRIIIGQLISTDVVGNHYYHLYMHIGNNPASIDLTPGATNGVLYDGMTAAGTMVYFTAKDALTTATDQDTDTSADIYRSDISGESATLTRVSTGEAGSGNTSLCSPAANSAYPHWNSVGEMANCDAVAVGGGGGVASGDGTFYFLSPERIDTSGPVDPVQDQPNLYVARPGSAPRFVATLESALTGPQPPATVLRFEKNIGPFQGGVNSVAVDDVTGDLYVLENLLNRVRKFDPDGNPVKFTAGSGINTNVLNGSDAPTGSFSQESSRPAQIAVDPSSGDLYVPDYNHNVVDVFKSTGAYDRQISVPSPSGVGIQPGTHHVYVSNFSESTVEIFSAAGSPLGSFATAGTPRGVAVDSAGTAYVITNSAFGMRVWVYDSTGEVVKMLSDQPVGGLVVDPTNDDVYLDQGDRIVQLDSSGKPTGGSDGVGGPIGIGNLNGSSAIALDSGRVYASNELGGKVAVIRPVLKPALAIDNPLVLDSVGAAGTRHTEDFQINPGGNQAIFSTGMQLADNSDNSGRYEIYRYDETAHSLACISCIPTGARPASDTFPSAYGLSLADDGRVFFTSAEPLALRDSNERKDAYEWEDGKLQLISAGTSESNSALLSASSDGANAFFFTRQRLVPSDLNGSSVRLYTARENGGFSVGPPKFQCAASDECHGPGSPPPAPASVGTSAGTPHQFQSPSPSCRKGKIRRRGRCVSDHHRKPHRHKRAGKAKQRGGK